MTEKMTVKEFLEKNKLDFGQGFILIPPKGIYLDKRVYAYVYIDIDYFEPTLIYSEKTTDLGLWRPDIEKVEELILTGFYKVRRMPWLRDYDVHYLLMSTHADIVRGKDGKLFWSSGYGLGDHIVEGMPNFSTVEKRWPVTDQGKEVNQELVFQDIRPGEFFDVDELLSYYSITPDDRRVLKARLAYEDEIIKEGMKTSLGERGEKMVERNEVEKMIKRLKELAQFSDFEDAHIEADDILVEYLEKAGEKELVEAYHSVGKWFA